MKSLGFGLEKEYLQVFLYLLAFTSEWRAQFASISQGECLKGWACIVSISLGDFHWVVNVDSHLYLMVVSWSDEQFFNFLSLEWISLGQWVIYPFLLFLFGSSLCLGGLKSLTLKLWTLGLCWDLEGCLVVFGLWLVFLGDKAWSFVVLVVILVLLVQKFRFYCILSRFLPLSFFPSSFFGIRLM